MISKDSPLQRKLMTAILVTSGAVLLLTGISFFAYEFYSFRNTSLQQLSTLGKLIATNSTAALAFDDAESAYETLSALEAEPHIIAAALYLENGSVLARYPTALSPADLPAASPGEGYVFEENHLQGFQPVI